MLVEDILSICCNSKVFTPTVFALVLNAVSVIQFLVAQKRRVAMKRRIVLLILNIMQ